MEKIPMTAIGFERLEKELKQLKTAERPAVIEARIAKSRDRELQTRLWTVSEELTGVTYPV